MGRISKKKGRSPTSSRPVLEEHVVVPPPTDAVSSSTINDDIVSSSVNNEVVNDDDDDDDGHTITVDEEDDDDTSCHDDDDDSTRPGAIRVPGYYHPSSSSPPYPGASSAMEENESSSHSVQETTSSYPEEQQRQQQQEGQETQHHPMVILEATLVSQDLEEREERLRQREEELNNRLLLTGTLVVDAEPIILQEEDNNNNNNNVDDGGSGGRDSSPTTTRRSGILGRVAQVFAHHHHHPPRLSAVSSNVTTSMDGSHNFTTNTTAYSSPTPTTPTTTTTTTTKQLSKTGLVGQSHQIAGLTNSLKRVVVMSSSTSSPPAIPNSNTMHPSSSSATTTTSTSTTREMVIISGPSGSGKTTLARTLQTPTHQLGGIFVSGKFQQPQQLNHHQDQPPYTGLISACNEICRALLQLKRSSHKDDNNTNDDDDDTRTNQNEEEIMIPFDNSNDSRFRDIQQTLWKHLGSGGSSGSDSGGGGGGGGCVDTLYHTIPLLKTILLDNEDDTHDSDHRLEESDAASSSSSSSRVATTTTTSHYCDHHHHDDHPGDEDDDDDDSRPLPMNNNCEEQRNRFMYAMKRFIQLVAEFCVPLVMHLDDLQWADSSSLELIETLLKDSSTHHLLLVGCYRSDEVDENHVLFQLLQRFQEEEESTSIITKIVTGNLSVSDVNTLLVRTLSCENNPVKSTLPLAELCHRRTLGNGFFLVEFINMLYRRSLLVYDMDQNKFVWDCKKIDTETMATENIVDLLTKQIELLDPTTRQLLILVSCFDSNIIDYPMVQAVWEELSKDQNEETFHILNIDDGGPSSTLEDSLQLAVDMGFLVKSSMLPNGYRWVHDKIQETVNSLLDTERKARLKCRMGEILFQKLQSIKNTLQEEGYVFAIVKLFDVPTSSSSAMENTSIKTIDLVKLHRRAAQRSVQLCAFGSALSYANRGISLMPERRWEEPSYFETSLELYTVAAELECYFGNATRVYELCTAILAQEHHPRLESSRKYRVYIALVTSIAGQARYEEAVSLCLHVLDQAGCRFPKSKASIHMATTLSVLRVKYRPPTPVSKFMSDPEKIQLMILLDRLAIFSYLAGNDLMTIVAMRLVQWTQQFGLCPYSLPAYTFIGIVLTGVLGDLKQGEAYACHALSLLSQSKREFQNVECRTMFQAYTCVLSWTQPLSTIISGLSKAYQIGLQTGDAESALFCQCNRICVAWFAGNRLQDIEVDIRDHDTEMKAFGNAKPRQFSNLTWQFLLNMMGRSSNPFVLEGEAMDEEIYSQTRKDVAFQSMIKSHQIILWTYLGNYREAAELALENGHQLSRNFPGIPLVMWDKMFSGLACAEMWRSTGQRRFYKFAQQALSQIKKWVRNGNPNVRHHELLLQAELLAAAVVDGKKSTKKNNLTSILVIKNYELAIGVSMHAGYIGDAALAHERLASFLSSKSKLNDAANHFNIHDPGESATSASMDHHWKEAIQLYSQWGAIVKVSQLQEKLGGASVV